MTGDENPEENEAPIKAYLYNKKEAYEDVLSKTGHDEREDHVKDLIKRIQGDFNAILDRRKKVEGIGIIYTQGTKFGGILVLACF